METAPRPPSEAQPEPIGAAVQHYTCVYTVRKKCYLCGAEWYGKSFVPQPPDVPPLPGCCAACLAEDEQRMTELLRQGPATESGRALPPLTRPERVREPGEEDA